jgi:hypothetical protein
MFAFVGYIVHANGIKFPWAMQLDGTPFPSVTNAPEAWDQISDAAKWQIFGFIGFLEFVSFALSLSAGCVCDAVEGRRNMYGQKLPRAKNRSLFRCVAFPLHNGISTVRLHPKSIT